MPQWVAKNLADAVSSQLQLQVGQAYETSVIIPYLNRAYEEIWDYHDWPSLTVVDSITLAAGTDKLVLPSQYAHLIYNLPPNQYQDPLLYDTLQKELVSVIRMGRVRWIQEYHPQYEAAFLGEQAVQVQPTAAGIVKVASTDATDTSKTVFVEGLLAGVYKSATLTTDSSTATTEVSSSVQFDKITGFSKGVKTTGSFVLYDSTGSVVLGNIDPWAYNSFYSTYQLAWKAGDNQSALTVYIIARRRFVPFLNTQSQPFMDKISAPLIDGATDLAMSEMRQSDYSDKYRNRMIQRLNNIKQMMTEPMEGPIYRC